MSELTPEQIEDMRAQVAAYDAAQAAAAQAAMDAQYMPLVTLVQSPDFASVQTSVSDALDNYTGMAGFEDFVLVLKSLKMSSETLVAFINSKASRLLASPEPDEGE